MELHALRLARGRRAWRAPLAALASLAVLAAGGCSAGAPLHTVTPTPTATPSSPVVPAEPSGTGGRSGVSSGALFGGDVPLATEAAKLGRKLAIVRDYYNVGESFPNATDRQLMAGGSTLLVSLDTTGSPSYASIAAGGADATFLQFMRAMEQAAVTYHLGSIYFCFQHEANSAVHQSPGTPAQFVQAWKHLHQLAASAHLNWYDGGRLHWVLILTNPAYRNGTADQYFPGTNEVDIIGADGYNTGTCRQALSGNVVSAGGKVKTPDQLFGPVLKFAADHGGLPVFIAEWGSIPYSSSAVQPDYIRQMQSFVESNPEIAAAMYWNSHGRGNGCDYSLNDRASALSALAAMGHARSLQGHVVQPG
ncbi:MAG TPA: hypothetical protein VGI31_09135 [Streptosporangiaceae bacterium]|jgi:hypothetical protein